MPLTGDEHAKLKTEAPNTNARRKGNSLLRHAFPSEWPFITTYY